MSRFLKLFLLSLFLVAVGCAGISRKSESMVTFKGPFADIIKNPEKHKGDVIKIGGKILDIETKNQKTFIVVLQRPLNFNDRPEKDKESQGRFLVQFDKFMDPAVYKTKNYITIVGKLTDTEVRPIGGYAYTYPILKPVETKFWKNVDTNDPRVYIGFGYTAWF